MRSCKNCIILLTLICLSFNARAQYVKLTKGQPVPFDTSAVIQISEYRKIRFKVNIADSLTKALYREVQKFQALASAKDSAQSVLILTQESNARTMENQAQTIRDLNNIYNKLDEAATRPTPFLKRRDVAFGGGALSVILLSAGIKLLSGL